MSLLSDELYSKELEAKDFLRDFINHSAVSISGGKDSLVALDLSIRAGIKRFVFGNTSLTYPGTEDYIKDLEDYYFIEIEQAKPPRQFMDLVNDIGYPSRRLRWCCEVYKFGPLTQYVLKNKIKFLITGIRAQESQKRKGYNKVSQNPLIPATQINPILEWTTEDIWEYIKFFELPYHPLYDKGYKRLGCWLCPFQSNGDFKKLQSNFPELFNNLQNSLRKNILKFGKVGVRQLESYIRENGWVRNALPIRNILKGNIEYEKNKKYSTFIISCSNNLIFSQIMENINLIKKRTKEIIIKKENLKLKIISKHLDINKVTIYTEKQINCVGCGACISLCPNSAISVKNKKMIIDFSKCNNCLRCLRTTELRAGCIARNYSPIRNKFNIINLNGEYRNFDNKLLNSNGLIKTRIKKEVVINKLFKFFTEVINEQPIYLKVNGIYSFSTNDLLVTIKKDRGFTLVNLNCLQHNVEEKLNLLINSLKK